MPVHVECAKRTFSVLALSTKNCNVFSLGHRYPNSSCFFHFYWQNPFTKDLFCRRYFTLVIIWVILANVFHKIARFVTCNYVKGEGSRFWLNIFNYLSLYRLKIMSVNEKEIMFTLLFIAGNMKWNFVSGLVWEKQHNQ